MLVGRGLSFATISAGEGHTCGLTVGGAAYCWGNDFYGQLGDGTTDRQASPVPVIGGLTFAVVSVSAGGWDTCGVTPSGAAYCWGGNDHGQLGDGTMNQRTSPVPVVGGLTFATITAGGQHTCGVTTIGVAYCWGWNGLGQLGDGTSVDRLTPVPVAGGLTFSTVRAAYHHTCGVSPSGVAYCWGPNDYGVLGDGTTNSSLVPIRVVQ